MFILSDTIEERYDVDQQLASLSDEEEPLVLEVTNFDNSEPPAEINQRDIRSKKRSGTFHWANPSDLTKIPEFEEEQVENDVLQEPLNYF